MIKILIFFIVLLGISSCIKDETTDTKKYRYCNELPDTPEYKCHETEVCKDGGGYPICDCKNEDEIWIDDKCKKPEITESGLEPFDASKKLSVFSGPKTSNRYRYLYIYNTEDKYIVQKYVEYKHGIDAPVLKSKLTGKYYFYDRTTYYDPFSSVDYGNGGLVEIDHITGKFKSVYVDRGSGKLFDVTNSGELIIVGGNSCEYISEANKKEVGTEGKIYNVKDKSYKSFCLPDEVKDVQYNENGNIYAYVRGYVETDIELGERVKIYEVDINTLKTKLIAHFEGINFIAFNQKDKLYVSETRDYNAPVCIDVSKEIPKVIILRDLEEGIKNAVGTLDFGVARGYIVNNNMYMEVWTYDFTPERHVIMKCNLSSNECDMLSTAGNTYQFGYLEDSNMLALGWQERGMLLDLDTEETIIPLAGKIYPKGYGIP